MLLGMLYLQDEHVKRNSKRAFEYLEMAAENGNYVIQGMIASIYKLAKNYSKAFEWYKKSSNVFIFDPCGFGDLYHYGLGVEKNYEKAIELYKIAERRELPEAKYNLGVMYYNGEGVNKDRNKAIELWTQAAEKGNEKAKKVIEKIETSLFDDKFEEIIKIYEKEAEMENDEAMYMLGFLFEERNKYEQDLEKAFEWYEKSATKGNAKAQFKLGSYYALGTTVDENLYKAFGWFEKAASQGHIRAQYFLAGMYRQGLGVKRDLNKATEWYKKAADQGDEDSIQVLRIMQSK